MTTSNFKGIKIKHPHSGKVSRSKIETAIIGETGAYHDNMSRADRVEWAVTQLKRDHGNSPTVRLEDIGNVIRVKSVDPF